MQYGQHHFRPDLHNEMRRGLCGEHVADTQHLPAKTLDPSRRREQRWGSRFHD
jgi:hypothetical protein